MDGGLRLLLLLVVCSVAIAAVGGEGSFPSVVIAEVRHCLGASAAKNDAGRREAGGEGGIFPASGVIVRSRRGSAGSVVVHVLLWRDNDDGGSNDRVRGGGGVARIAGGV